jgi:prepilin-type N-terminal cleavage/methylation domain-containing protein
MLSAERAEIISDLPPTAGTASHYFGIMGMSNMDKTIDPRRDAQLFDFRPHSEKQIVFSVFSVLERVKRACGEKNGPIAMKAQPRNNGFTLLELIVVLALIGIMLSVVIPSVYSAVPGEAERKFRRQLDLAPGILRQRAIAEARTFTWMIDLTRQRVWSVHSEMTPEMSSGAEAKAFKAPKTLRIVAMTIEENDRLATGIARVQFFPDGSATRAVIQLRDDDDQTRTLLVDRFLPAAKWLDRHAR